MHMGNVLVVYQVTQFISSKKMAKSMAPSSGDISEYLSEHKSNQGWHHDRFKAAYIWRRFFPAVAKKTAWGAGN